MDTHPPRFRVLFLCTGNSARSILAEYLLRRLASDRFDVFSAGSHPKPAPHPLALRVLNEHYRLDTTTALSKSWEEFADVRFDFVITLCDSAKERCPVFPGQPIFAHWGSPDPADAGGDEATAYHVFWLVSQQINRRLELFANLPFPQLDALRLETATRAIGQQEILTLSQPIHS